MSAIKIRAKSDGLQLLRAINATQAYGQQGVRADPTRAAHDAGLDVGDVGSDRYHHALHYLIEEAPRCWETSTQLSTSARSTLMATRPTSSPGGR